MQGNQNVVEKDGALTVDFSILLNQTVEGLYQIFLPCTMKIHHRSYQNVQFKGGYVVDTLTPIDGNINARKYIEILETNLWPVIVKDEQDQTGQPAYIFKEDNASCRRKTEHPCHELAPTISGLECY